MLNSVIGKVQQVFNPQDQGIDWVGDFSGATDLESVIEAKEQLAKVDFLMKKNLEVKIQAVLNLDEKVHQKVQSLTHSYLTALRNNESLKKTVEVVVYEYLRRLYATYTLILDETLHQKKLALSTDEINLILLRYLNALFLMTKWRYFDDQEAPLGVWSNVHKVIRLTETLAIMNRNLFLYAFQTQETSIASILKRGFMLDTLQKGSYNQLQIELTDRIVKTWSTNPLISQDYEHNQYQFFIHMEGDKRPQRLRGAKGHANFRYWKTQRIVDLIEGYLCAVDTRKPLDSFKLTNMASTEEFVQLFKKLRVDWCVKGYKRQRRSERRNPNFNMLNVVHGIEDVCSRVNRAQQAKPKLFAEKSKEVADELALVDQGASMEYFGAEFNTVGGENWAMLEESNTGFSVDLVKSISPWVKSGVLIGYSTKGYQNKVSIAEVKTVRKKANGSYRLGLLKISQQAIALKVSLVQKNTVFNPVQGYEVDDGHEDLSYSAEFMSLLIDEGDRTKSKLIVPKSRYKRAHRYQVTINGEQHTVLAGDVVSKHHNWVCFEVIV